MDICILHTDILHCNAFTFHIHGAWCMVLCNVWLSLALCQVFKSNHISETTEQMHYSINLIKNETTHGIVRMP